MLRHVLALVAALIALPAAAQQSDPENTWVLELSTGEVQVRLRPDLAPQHVDQIKALTRAGFYDGVVFHRVIEGFMAQSGDPTGTGTGGSDEPDLVAEFTQTPFVRGTLGMARASDPDSANSQFFIMFDEGSFLNGQYTVFGEVISGMEAVDALARGEPPARPDRIVTARILGDAN